MALLFSQGVGDRHEPRSEDGSPIALRTEGSLSPQDECSQGALGSVVRGLDAPYLDEGPQGLAVLQDVLTGAADAADAKSHAVIEMTLDHGSEARHQFAKLTTRHGSIAHPVPGMDHGLRAEEQVLAQYTGRPRSLFESDKKAYQVRPADLALVHGPETELCPAIADEDPADLRKQRTQPGHCLLYTSPSPRD